MSVLRLIAAFALLLLSGCQNRSQPAPAVPDFAARCPSGSPQERTRCAWINEIQWRVSGNVDRMDRYRGQRCDVTIGYDPQRGYQVLRTEGDEALCLKSWQAVSSVRQLPTPPSGAPRQIMVTFRPA